MSCDWPSASVFLPSVAFHNQTAWLTSGSASTMHVIFSFFLPVGIVMFEHKTFGAAKGKKLTHGREQSSLIMLTLGHIGTLACIGLYQHYRIRIWLYIEWGSWWTEASFSTSDVWAWVCNYVQFLVRCNYSSMLTLMTVWQTTAEVRALVSRVVTSNNLYWCNYELMS